MGNAVQEVYEKIKSIFLNNSETKEKWNDLVKIEGFGDFMKSFTILFWFAKKIVYIVEYVQSELDQINKEEKIELAVKILDDLIQFKGWAVIFEPFDNMVYKILVSAAVSAMNDKWGKNWLGGACGVENDPQGSLVVGIHTALELPIPAEPDNITSDEPKKEVESEDVNVEREVSEDTISTAESKSDQ